MKQELLRPYRQQQPIRLFYCDELSWERHP
jgi:hypothetical protein